MSTTRAREAYTLREISAFRCRAARRRVNLTQRALAGKAGIATGTVARAELGQAGCGVKAKQAIAGALGVRLEEIFPANPLPGVLPD